MNFSDRGRVLVEAVTDLDGTDLVPALRGDYSFEDDVENWVPAEGKNDVLLDFESVQMLRQATHFYDTQRSVTPDELATVCEAMSAPETGLEVVAFVRDVEGLRPGVYLWGTTRFGLVCEASEDELDRIEWVLQLEFARSPVFVAVVGDIGACADMHAYRRMVVKAGSMCQEGWLAAVARGLAGTIFAGIIQGGIRDLGFDATRRNAIVAFSFGHPVRIPGAADGGRLE